MKKKIIPMCLAASLLIGTIPAFAEEAAVNVSVNGTQVVFADQKPVIEEERTLVPVRGVLEAMGIEVTWDKETQTIEMKQGDTTASLVIGSNVLTKGEENITLDVAPKIIGERTMLPIRAVAEAFGAEVTWNETTNEVSITTASQQTDGTDGTENAEYTIEKTDVVYEAVEGTNAYSKASYTATLKNAEGTSLIEVNAAYPALNGKTTQDATVNELIASDITSIVDNYLQNSADNTAKEAAELKESFHTHSLYINFEDVYYDETANVLSYLKTVSTYTGGAHANTLGYGVTIDLAEGKQISISEATNQTGEEAVTDVQRAILFLTEEITANPDNYFEGAADYLSGTADGQFGCYLGENKVIVFASAGSVAAYAQGMLKFEIEI